LSHKPKLTLRQLNKGNSLLGIYIVYILRLCLAPMNNLIALAKKKDHQKMVSIFH